MSLHKRILPLAEIEALVGQPLGVTEWITLRQDMIDNFAALTHDPERIHIDPERGGKTQFGGTIAHGFLTLSFLSSFAYALVPMPDDMDHPVNYGFDKVRFTGPVPSGGRIRGSMVLSALEPGPVTKLHLKVSVEVENQPRPALVADWIIGAIRH